MPSARTLASLFEDEPRQWGLRGDPHLWRDIQRTLSDAVFPDTEAQLTAALEQIFQELTGVPLSHGDPVYVERYSPDGMSGGFVSPKFWFETALPLLRARYRAANDHC